MKKLIKKIIPKEYLKGFKLSMHIEFIKLMSKTNFLTSLYYTFSGRFNREHKSVLKGKLKHLQDMKRKTSNLYLLRRNIHRIEKGLLMRPMRKVFAIDYIDETIYCYKSLLTDFHNNNLKTVNELKWAHDVLTKYFRVTDSHKIINRIQEIFESLDHVTKKNNIKYIPYTRDFEHKPSISLNQLLELAKFRRSVRWFENKKVPRNIIDNAAEVAKLSPSACNRQPFKFKFIDEPNLLSKLCKIPMGTKGYAYNIPIMAAVIGDLSAYPYERDRHLIYIDSSLAVMSFILALESQGVSSCIINWPDIESKEKSISKFLNLREHNRVIMLIGIGYPDKSGKVAYSEKKDLSEIRSYN